MSIYSIKDLELLTGVKAHTIRMWEKRYNLISPGRTDTNIRFYTEDQLKRLLNMVLLNKSGFKISKIASFSDSELSCEVRKINNTLTDNALQIEQLISAMVNFDENAFITVLNKEFIKHGFEDTLLNVAYHFFEKTGILWQTGAITASHEQFVAAILKQKIYASLDKIMITPEENAPTIIFALPENEYHEIPLLSSNYIAKRRGFKTIYLGQNINFDELCEVIKFTNSTILITFFITSHDVDNISSYLTKLSRDFPHLRIFVGCCNIGNTGCDNDNIVKICDLTALKQVLTDLKIVNNNCYPPSGKK